MNRPDHERSNHERRLRALRRRRRHRILDGIIRNTPEGREFVRVAASEGVREVITRRDGPWGDYSQGPPEAQPRRRSDLGA